MWEGHEEVFMNEKNDKSDMSWLLCQDIVQVPNVQMLHIIKHQKYITKPPP